jgi:hypothetical protein
MGTVDLDIVETQLAQASPRALQPADHEQIHAALQELDAGMPTGLVEWPQI